MKATELIEEIQSKIDENQEDFEVLIDNVDEYYDICCIGIEEHNNKNYLIIYPDD